MTTVFAAPIETRLRSAEQLAGSWDDAPQAAEALFGPDRCVADLVEIYEVIERMDLAFIDYLATIEAAHDWSRDREGTAIVGLWERWHDVAELVVRTWTSHSRPIFDGEVGQKFETQLRNVRSDRPFGYQRRLQTINRQLADEIWDKLNR